MQDCQRALSALLSRPLSDGPQVLCLLGLKKLDCQQLIQWLSQEDRWLFLVDDSPAPSPLVNHSRVHCFFVETNTLLHQSWISQQIARQTLLQSIEMLAETGWETFACQIEECHRTAHLLLSDVADFGIGAFRNARKNWQEQGPFLDWTLLKGSFAQVPAIVCGAGPSLEEAIPFLKQQESSAFVLAAGTALPLLSRYGIEPHLGCAIDQETPSSVWAGQAAELPCCFQSRLNPDVVSLFHGPKILAPESGSLPWEEWWRGEQDPPAFGWTVGNFATEIARWMGCNPIIWVGMDFCYREGKKYAGGLEGHAAPLVATVNRNNQPVWTQRDWLMAREWSNQCIRAHPQVRFINTALEGLAMGEAISCATLSFERQFDLRGRFHALLAQAKPLHIGNKEEWSASVERCLARSQWIGEPVYEYYLAPLWRLYEPLFMREAMGQHLESHRLLFFQQVLSQLKE